MKKLFVIGYLLLVVALSASAQLTTIGPAAAGFNGGTITSPLVISPASGSTRLNLPISLSPFNGGFQLGIQETTAAVGNSFDNGRTFTDGVTTSGSPVITSAANAFFSLGDMGRAITGTGIPASTRVLSIPQTTIAAASNVTALPQGTITVASTTGFPTAGKIEVQVGGGYQIVTYTGVTSTTFTGCTGGTGTMRTSGRVNSLTSATLTANATATASSVSLTIAGKSDSPLGYGFNIPGDTAYSANDASFSFTIEPTYTTASGIRQIEHYLTFYSEGGQQFLGRIFAVNAMLYDTATHKEINTATANFYFDSSVFGNKNNLNDAMSFSPAESPADPSYLGFSYGAKQRFNTAARDYVIDANGGVLGDQVAVTSIGSASNAVNVSGAATITVASTTGFGSTGTINVATNNGNQFVNYTGKTATTFTGCSLGYGATGGLMATNGVVSDTVVSGTGRVFAGKTTTTVDADQSNGTVDMYFAIGDPTSSYGVPMRWNHLNANIDQPFEFAEGGGGYSYQPILGGLRFTRKNAVNAVAIANQATLSGTAQTIDGVALDTTGMRVLLTAQSSGAQNGIWRVNSGAWTRPADFPNGTAGARVKFGAQVFVISGTTYAGTDWGETASNLFIDGDSQTWTILNPRKFYTTTVFDSAGSGSPESAVTAGIGSTYRRTDGGAGTSFYVKESGTGNTGWIAK